MAIESRIVRSEQERVIDCLRHGPNSVHGIVEATGLRSGDVFRAVLELIADDKVAVFRQGHRDGSKSKRLLLECLEGE